MIPPAEVCSCVAIKSKEIRKRSRGAHWGGGGPLRGKHSYLHFDAQIPFTGHPTPVNVEVFYRLNLFWRPKILTEKTLFDVEKFWRQNWFQRQRIWTEKTALDVRIFWRPNLNLNVRKFRRAKTFLDVENLWCRNRLDVEKFWRPKKPFLASSSSLKIWPETLRDSLNQFHDRPLNLKKARMVGDTLRRRKVTFTWSLSNQ